MNTHRIDAEEFSMAFAIAATETSDKSDKSDDLIPKKGENSIFSVLNEIFPQASPVPSFLEIEHSTEITT